MTPYQIENLDFWVNQCFVKDVTNILSVGEFLLSGSGYGGKKSVPLKKNLC